MVNAQRHVSLHSFEGEDGGRAAADWLNRNQGTRPGRVVSNLIKNMQQLIPSVSMGEWIGLEQSGMSRREYVKSLNNINRQLAAYSMWPMLVGRSTSFGRLGKRGLHARTKFKWRWSHGKDPATETIHNIVRLGELGLLFRLRQCALCHIWFYARFSHQLNCSARCREKRFKSGPQWRKYRRDYMRDHRKRQRESDARAIANLKEKPHISRSSERTKETQYGRLSTGQHLVVQIPVCRANDPGILEE
jgi:hypothetical protein